MAEVTPMEEFNKLGAGVRVAQKTTLLSQLRGTEIGEQLTLARDMLFPAAHEFQATSDLSEDLEELRAPLRELTTALGYYERAASAPHTFGDSLRNNIATMHCADELRIAVTNPVFAGSWGGLALRDLALDARALAQRADRLCDTLTMEYSPAAPACVLPLMLATQTAMEAGATVHIQAMRAWRQHELAAAGGLETRGFVVRLEGTASVRPPVDLTVVRANMALREYGGFGGLGNQPLILDGGSGEVDYRLADHVVRQAAQLRHGRPLTVRTQGAQPVAQRLDNLATQTLAGAPLPGEYRQQVVQQVAI